MATTAADPVGSYIRQLQLAFETTDGVTTGRLPVHPALCSAPGLVRIGALTILADCVAGFDALSAFDMAWVGTSELGIHGPFGTVVGDEIIATGRLLKQRKSGGVFEISMRDSGRRDGHGPLATATVTLSLLSQQRGSKLDSAIAEHTGQLAPVTPLTSLSDVLEPRSLPGRGLALELTDNVRNSWQVLSGGVAALLTELAAQEAAAEALGGHCIVDGLSLHFLAPGRSGPVEARADVLAAQTDRNGIAPGTAHLSVRLTDAGAEDRLIVAATATAHRSPA